eukprot:4945626-Lingulodinium_polyedra.AAC.1
MSRSRAVDDHYVEVILFETAYARATVCFRFVAPGRTRVCVCGSLGEPRCPCLPPSCCRPASSGLSAGLAA